jgi:hypothetical protein
LTEIEFVPGAVPYLRWLLLVILNLPATIAVRAVVTIIYPTTAITMWTDLHCHARLRQCSGSLGIGGTHYDTLT